MLNNCRVRLLTHQMSASIKSFFIILASGALANAPYGDSP